MWRCFWLFSTAAASIVLVPFACNFMKVNTVNSRTWWHCTLARHFLNQGLQIDQHMYPAAFRLWAEQDSITVVTEKVRITNICWQINVDYIKQIYWLNKSSLCILSFKHFFHHLCAFAPCIGHVFNRHAGGRVALRQKRGLALRHLFSLRVSRFESVNEPLTCLRLTCAPLQSKCQGKENNRWSATCPGCCTTTNTGPSALVRVADRMPELHTT